jgi:hypothetical protein
VKAAGRRRICAGRGSGPPLRCRRWVRRRGWWWRGTDRPCASRTRLFDDQSVKVPLHHERSERSPSESAVPIRVIAMPTTCEGDRDRRRTQCRAYSRRTAGHNPRKPCDRRTARRVLADLAGRVDLDDPRHAYAHARVPRSRPSAE